MDAFASLSELPGRSFFQTWLLSHGQSWRLNERATPTGEPGNCYENALLYALDNQLLYCEGVAVSDRSTAIPISHAWCVDGSRVIDITWAGPASYFGIAFRWPWLRQWLLQRGTTGPIIDDWMQDWPLVRGKCGGPEVWQER